MKPQRPGHHAESGSLPGISGEKGPASQPRRGYVLKEAPLLHNRHQHVTAERGQLLKPLLWGELEPLGLKGLELVSKLRAHARDLPRRR